MEDFLGDRNPAVQVHALRILRLLADAQGRRWSHSVALAPPPCLEGRGSLLLLGSQGDPQGG